MYIACIQKHYPPSGVRKVRKSGCKGQERRGNLYSGDGNVRSREHRFLEQRKGFRVAILKAQIRDFESQGPREGWSYWDVGLRWKD